MKKIFAVMLLAMSIIFVGNNQAEATEYYAGRNRSGADFYLIEESSHKNKALHLCCTVRIVYNKQSALVDYEFSIATAGFWWRNSYGQEATFDPDDTDNDIMARIFRKAEEYAYRNG